MLRYSIHALVAFVVWFTLVVIPVNATPCATGIAQASHELRAAPQAALLHRHEHGDSAPCQHGSCSVCCTVCSVAVGPALPASLTVLDQGHERPAHGPPPQWTLPNLHLSLLPFRPRSEEHTSELQSLRH